MPSFRDALPPPPDRIPDLDDDFSAGLSAQRWVPHYLPHWTTRDRSEARYRLTPEGLELRIEQDQLDWRPDDAPLRVSNLQTGTFSGPVGSERGTHRHRDDGLVVRTETPERLLFAPSRGRVDVTVSATRDPGCMLAAWHRAPLPRRLRRDLPRRDRRRRDRTDHHRPLRHQGAPRPAADDRYGRGGGPSRCEPTAHLDRDLGRWRDHDRMQRHHRAPDAPGPGLPAVPHDRPVRDWGAVGVVPEGCRCAACSGLGLQLGPNAVTARSRQDPCELESVDRTIACRGSGVRSWAPQIVAISAKEPVMRVSAYHSINATDPDVHHVFDNCPSGQQIPARNRRQGTNGWPLCGHCARM